MNGLIKEMEVEVDIDNLEELYYNLDLWNKNNKNKRVEFFHSRVRAEKFFIVLRVEKGSDFVIEKVVNKDRFPLIVGITLTQTVDLKMTAQADYFKIEKIN